MTEQERETRLPSSEEIAAAYEKLFGNETDGVKQFRPSGTRYVELPGGLILVEQNRKKDSTWGKQARAGHKIAWVMKDGDYLARVVDGNVHILHHQ